MNTRNLTVFIQDEISVIDRRIPANDFEEVILKGWKESLCRIKFQSKLNADSYSIVKQCHLELVECMKTQTYVRQHLTNEDTNVFLLLLTVGDWKTSLEHIYDMMMAIPALHAALIKAAKEEQ